jgi:hypothetical protein
MFALNPHGKGGAGEGSQRSAVLWYFGQLGIYFGAIRLAYVFWAGREEGTKALKE